MAEDSSPIYFSNISRVIGLKINDLTQEYCFACPTSLGLMEDNKMYILDGFRQVWIQRLHTI